MVGLEGVEPSTSRLSGVRSNHLSYKPSTSWPHTRSSLTFGMNPEKKPHSDYQIAKQALLRKEVIQPHLPVRLPCYDLAPVMDLTLGTCLPEGLAQRRQVLPTSIA